MKKIKVLQVSKLYAPWIGGIERVIQDIAEGLNEKTDMKVLVCQPKGKGKTEEYNGVKVTRAGSLGIFFSMPVSFDFFFKLRKMAKETDIINFHVPFPLSDIAFLLSGYKGRSVVWWHSDIVNQKAFLFLLRPFINKFLKKADTIITATEGHIESSSFLKPYREKCRIIPYGIDLKEYERQDIKNFLTDRLQNGNNKKLLFAGRLIYYKGIDILIRAMKNVTNAELFIIGEGRLENEMKSLANNLGIGDVVHFLKPLPFDELKAAYDDCDIFVFPSVANSEAFGIVQLEAMFYGKPVINTALPTGVPYVSIDGETGLTVPVSDVNALEQAINILSKDDELRERLGKNAKRRVSECFSVDRMNEELLRCYRELLS